MNRNVSLIMLVWIFLSQFAAAQTAIGGVVTEGAIVVNRAPNNSVPNNSVSINDASINDVSEAKPIQFLPYDQSEVINQEQRDTLNYQLALAPYKKRQNRWQPEKSIRLQGRLYRETHELMSGFDEQDVYDFYKSQVPSAAKLLFECARRDCGESNSWANDHFKIKQLYGLDQYQFYSVHQLGDDQYITLYVVRRGNRRIYTQIDSLIFKPIKHTQ